MKKHTIDMVFTKTSSKGQVVIPITIRKELNIHNGSILAVIAEKDLIIFKKVDSELTPADLKTLKLVEEAWKDIEEGKYKTRSKDDFFKELKEW